MGGAAVGVAENSNGNQAKAKAVKVASKSVESTCLRSTQMLGGVNMEVKTRGSARVSKYLFRGSAGFLHDHDGTKDSKNPDGFGRRNGDIQCPQTRTILGH